MRLNIFCRKRACSQLIDLSQMDCLQVSESEHRGGMIHERFYDVLFLLKVGTSLMQPLKINSMTSYWN